MGGHDARETAIWPNARSGRLLRIFVVQLVAVALLAIGGAPATAGTDASDTCAGAGALPAGSWHYETLSSAGDIDWFVFTRPDSRWAMITLGGLGANYRLDLFLLSGRRSQRLD